MLDFPLKAQDNDNWCKEISFPERLNTYFIPKASAKCIGCGYKWETRKIIDHETFIECPSCGCKKGVLRESIQYKGVIFVCSCGCDVFHLDKKRGLYCPNCGKVMTMEDCGM